MRSFAPGVVAIGTPVTSSESLPVVVSFASFGFGVGSPPAPALAGTASATSAKRIGGALRLRIEPPMSPSQHAPYAEEAPAWPD